VWIHPTDRSLSTIIGTDKQGALEVYDLGGRRLFRYLDGEMNNVDLRYNFPLGGARVDVVVASDQASDTLRIYRVDPVTRGLVDVTAGSIPVGLGIAGLCMYHSPTSGRYYVFDGDSSGTIQQWELTDAGSGKVTATKARQFTLSSVTEGCVADDVHAALFISQEDVALWRYGAEPGAGTTRTQVDAVGSRLTADIEGVAIYYRSDGSGYLVASSQGDDSYTVYQRAAPHAFVTKFRIAAGIVDGVTHTDGLDVTNAALGPAFPFGALITQDDDNNGLNQNFKLVPWERAAGGTPTTLAIDTSWDPRSIGR
jgi:3-phytase